MIEVYLIKNIKNYKIQLLKKSKGNQSDIGKFDKFNNNFDKCYYSSDNYNLKIIHLIITRFMIEFHPYDGFPKKIYEKSYIFNGIRVLSKYLFPSLENQSCKKFIWVLMIGDKANKTYIESLLQFNFSFDYKIIYQKSIKTYIRKITKGYHILITSRIDYDDLIYYDAVNDVRKEINIHKPIQIYGYNRGVFFYEIDNKYYEFYKKVHKNGAMSVFISLIIVLNKVNDSYTVYDLGVHYNIRKYLLKSYKSFGIANLDYEPAIFDNGDTKFVWVRQKFSGKYEQSKRLKNNLKLYNFNITKFFGKIK